MLYVDNPLLLSIRKPDPGLYQSPASLSSLLTDSFVFKKMFGHHKFSFVIQWHFYKWWEISTYSFLEIVWSWEKILKFLISLPFLFLQSSLVIFITRSSSFHFDPHCCCWMSPIHSTVKDYPDSSFYFACHWVILRLQLNVTIVFRLLGKLLHIPCLASVSDWMFYAASRRESWQYSKN